MGKYRIFIKKSAVKEIEHLPARDLKFVLAKIESLADNPRPYDSKKISAHESYRVRWGLYRIIYIIEDRILVVYVVKVGHRRDVYR